MLLISDIFKYIIINKINKLIKKYYDGYQDPIFFKIYAILCSSGETHTVLEQVERE